MVRTRSIGKINHNNSQESSFKPSSKGRKRQITNTEEDSSPSVLTSSAALSPLPGHSGSYSRYTNHQDDLSQSGRGSSSSGGSGGGTTDQVEPMEPTPHWEDQEGFRSPGGSHAHLSQVANHPPATSGHLPSTSGHQTLAVGQSSLAAGQSSLASSSLGAGGTSAMHTASAGHSGFNHQLTGGPQELHNPHQLHPLISHSVGSSLSASSAVNPGSSGLNQAPLSSPGSILNPSASQTGSSTLSTQQNSVTQTFSVSHYFTSQALSSTPTSALLPVDASQHPPQGEADHLQPGAANSSVHQVGDDTSPPPPPPPFPVDAPGQDLNPRAENPAADLVIFTTRESGVQADVETLPPPQQDRDNGAGFLPDDIKHSLECPVCARIALPPVMQCRNGHVTCNSCRIKVQSCPMCREIDIDIRNLFAEKAITYMSIPCEYKSFGCRVEIHFKDKEMHERQCRYRPYICPYIECDHKLAADAVVLHVSSAHREECRRSDGPEITASMILIGMYFGGDGAWSPRVITCFGRTFFDVALTRDRWLHHWVWLLGEEEEANHYIYEITAFKGNTKYVYSSEVSSLRTSDDEIVSEGKCLSISDAIGRRLRDGDKIRYKLKLMRK